MFLAPVRMAESEQEALARQVPLAAERQVPPAADPEAQFAAVQQGLLVADRDLANVELQDANSGLVVFELKPGLDREGVLAKVEALRIQAGVLDVSPAFSSGG